MRHAVKQRNSKLLFEISDLLADRRLTNSKLLGRPREIPLLCHRHEITDMTQFHWHLSLVIAGDDERSAAALPPRSQDGFGDRAWSCQSYSADA